MNGNGFRSAVSNNRLVAALIAGVVSTHMATVTGYWYRMIGFNPDDGFYTLDWPFFNGFLLLQNTDAANPTFTPLEQFWAGLVFHSLTGICFGLIFAFLVHPRLPLKNTMWGNLGKAFIWGGILALISALWWVPSNFPAFNPGVLSLNLGVKTTIGIFLWHAVYAVHLGAFYNPLPEEA